MIQTILKILASFSFAVMLLILFIVPPLLATQYESLGKRIFVIIITDLFLLGIISLIYLGS